MLKQLVKKSLTSAVNFPVLSSVMMRLRRDNVPVFMMHRMEDLSRGVEGHSADVLAQILEYLCQNNYNFLSLADLVEAITTNQSVPPKSVVFTMDDGFYDQADIAIPIFESYSCPVSIFLLSNFSSEQSWPWDYQVEYIVSNTEYEAVIFDSNSVSYNGEVQSVSGRKAAIDAIRDQLNNLEISVVLDVVNQLSRDLSVSTENIPESYAPITWERAKSCESKYVSFGPHTANHCVLKSQTDERCREEMAASWHALEKHLKKPLPVMCYPIGKKDKDFSKREMVIARELGMTAGLSVNPGYVELSEQYIAENLYCLHRFNVPDNLTDFVQLCSWIEVAKEKMRGN